MSGALQTWFDARTSRERLLLRGGAVVAAACLGIAIYLQAASWRAAAAADLLAAQALLRDVGEIAAAPAPTAPSGDPRSIALAAAERAGIVAARIEPVGADGLVIGFDGVDSRAVYQWLAIVERDGLAVRRTAISRAESGLLVRAEFEVAVRR